MFDELKEYEITQTYCAGTRWHLRLGHDRHIRADDGRERNEPRE